MKQINWGTRAFTVLVLTAAMAIALRAQTPAVLFKFDGTNGMGPLASLIQGTSGDFYGTTNGGGATNNGTVFRISSSGKLKTLYSFCSKSECTDGAYLYGALVQGTNGDFYGTTNAGGDGDQGTVFKITATGTLTVLHRFCSQSECPDGSGPTAGLIQGTNGDFYGTTQVGGAFVDYGTVFEITPDGKLTTLHSFDGTDGSGPVAALIQASNGNLYGTTLAGGTNDAGTVFEIAPRGTFTSLYSFCSQSECADGDYPRTGLVEDAEGNLYGTTEGGQDGTSGTVFKITQTGTLTTLYSFCAQSGCPDGKFPYAALVLGTDGNLYGMASQGGANMFGTIFKVTTSGAFTKLSSFCTEARCGDDPMAGLVQGTNGDFYGTTYYSANNAGIIFRLSEGLGAFVETQTNAGKVGAAVKILGTDLTGATSVTFDGTAAAFTVVSASEITTTVPTGATTGTVEVVTPNGTLSSNAPFQVLP
jgi:uncharacterized repeat protein (TIGR03803 family)